MEHEVPTAWSGLFERLRGEREAKERLMHARREVARRLARILAERFDVRRVVLFGSLARGDISGHLDIDLAVEGLPRELELGALSTLNEEAGCRVDLVRCEDATPRLLAAIARDGEVLHVG